VPTTYLHPSSLSPDPTLGLRATPLVNNQETAKIYPQRLVGHWPESDEVVRWADNLNLFSAPQPLVLHPDANGCTGLLIDFATEVDGEVVIEIETLSLANVLFWRGESLIEAEGKVRDGIPHILSSRHVPGPGKHRVQSEPLGFRFVRIEFHDLKGPVTLSSIAAHATWTFQQRDGDFLCSDRRFQRVWQSSVYTARLCTRPDTYWDGIKRDRHGWFGDGRIIKEATDQVFFDPRPAEAMLLSMPTDQWANGIPNYSFDAIAMLRMHILRYGRDRECIKPAFAAIVTMLEWVRKTQINEDGFIVRRDNQHYAFEIGFVDWSEFPLGGRLEELGWLQATYLIGLRNAAKVAIMLDEKEQALHWQAQADALARQIHQKFWSPRVGYIHTLNHVGQPSNPHHPFIAYRDWHAKRTYEEGIQLGPSGPSRQANAYAILAGLGDASIRRTILDRVFNNSEISPVITPYFAYYEQRARALCGDPTGALEVFRNYIGNMLEVEDSATLWEYYIPEIRDLRRYSSHLDIDFPGPTSLCHGWGAGVVPLTTELLLGINPTQPGFSEVLLKPVANLPWSYQATVPTPSGPISIQKDKEDSTIRYRIPKGISVRKDPSTSSNILVERC